MRFKNVLHSVSDLQDHSRSSVTGMFLPLVFVKGHL